MDLVSEEDRDGVEPADGVYLAELAGVEGVEMMYWRIDPGATLPPHRHDNEQVGYVVSGELTALVEGEEVAFGPGDSYAFESGELHGAENRGDEPVVGIGVLSPPRERPEWGHADAADRSDREGDAGADGDAVPADGEPTATDGGSTADDGRTDDGPAAEGRSDDPGA